MQRLANDLGSLGNIGAESRAGGVGGGDVCHHAIAKEGSLAHSPGMVKVLGDQGQVAGFYLFAQTASSGEGENLSRTQLFKGIDIGPVIDLVRKKLVAGAMAGKK